MVCTTFLYDCELNVNTSNSEINSLLAEIRNKTGDNHSWQVIERQIILTPAWWNFLSTKKTVSRFNLYRYVGGCGPWQCINFYTDSSGDNSLVGLGGVDASVIVNFLYGLLAGLQESRRASDVK